MNITYKTTDGKQISFFYATNLEELSLANYCDWLPLFDQYLELTNESDNEQFHLNYLMIGAKMVSAWAGTPIEEALGLPQGDISEHLEQAAEAFKEIDTESLEATLMKLLAVSLKAVSTFEPKAIQSFAFDGKEYFLSEENREALKVDTNNAALSTMEAVEALTMQQKVKAFKANLEDKFYHQYLAQIAILCHGEGASLPTDDVVAATYIDRQIEYFAKGDLKASTALNIDFFFGGRLELLKRTLPAASSLIPLSLLPAR